MKKERTRMTRELRLGLTGINEAGHSGLKKEKIKKQDNVK